MDVVLQSLTQHQALIFFFLAAGITLCFLFVVALFLRLRQHERRWKLLWMSSHGSSVEELLLEHLNDRILISNDLATLEERVRKLEHADKNSKRFLGLVRYDAFPDVAGFQSFALALFDEEGDGAILSSIVGRSSCRVFCKPLVGGRSERDLTQEEHRALKSAREGGVRTILSP